MLPLPLVNGSVELGMVFTPLLMGKLEPELAQSRSRFTDVKELHLPTLGLNLVLELMFFFIIF